ncbi:MAG: preprotein translocase subunit YajC [Actinobacteria bacterium]|nr:preprotein translocase subunit YajC [Actinomycetota bacterium]MCG2818705.1 preprotein translocase subunit YajC [Actinomycetes bacterium]MBU4218601.1 preprotein translocase subunit YajC [Actinomycetota bacterium]MBU4359865.1 preprotein translocase subunit YajC [Actinomycetota bacterium]MBU4391130.1 preprotein translocase subunit YajC [Actinomycetota bacterium]
MEYVLGLLVTHQMLLQNGTEEAAKTSGVGAWGMYALIAIMVAVFYFLLIRPQRKRAKDHESMVSELRKGDEVVTIGGIHGILKRISDDIVVVEVDKGVRMTLSRSAISKSITEHEEEELEEEEYEEEEYEEEEEEYEEEADDESEE